MADEAMQSFVAFDEALTDFEKVLRPLLEAVEKAGAEDSSVPNVTAARIHATLAYTVNALYYVYLRANNNNEEDSTDGSIDDTHPVYQELERIQKVFVKLRTVDRKVSGTTEETMVVHGMQVRADKLDKFLTPVEENLAHALRGNREARQKHKVFSSDKVPKKRKKKAVAEIEDANDDEGNDGDVEMTPVKTTKKKKSKKAKKEILDDENAETEATTANGTSTAKKKRKSRKSDTEADTDTAAEGSTKKKRKSSKKDTPSTQVVAPEQEAEILVRKTSRKKKREKTTAN